MNVSGAELVAHSDASKIHLLESTSATENLEALGPIIKTINESRQQESFLRTINDLIESKDNEIQKICSDNYLVSRVLWPGCSRDKAPTV